MADIYRTDFVILTQTLSYQHKECISQMFEPKATSNMWNNTKLAAWQSRLCIWCREIVTEKEFLDLTTSEERCIVHFYHTDFRRCAIMHTHLEVSAKFCYINVTNFILTIFCLLFGWLLPFKLTKQVLMSNEIQVEVMHDAWVMHDSMTIWVTRSKV